MTAGFKIAFTLLAALAESHSTAVAALEAAPQADSAKAAWIAAGRPIQGVHEAGAWIFAGHREAVDPGSAGFESVEMDACKQMAMSHLVRHCTGEGSFQSPLAAPLNALVDGEMWSWYSGKLNTAGSVWIESRRTAGHDVAVIALPSERCRAMPKRANWRDHLIEVARESDNWIVVAVLAESAAPDSKAEAADLVSLRLRQATLKAGPVWPPAFVKVPHQIGASETRGLGLGELARLASMRPGDTPLWESLAQRCAEAGLVTGAQRVREAATAFGWPRPAATEGSVSWSTVAVGDLPSALAAVIRTGGAVPATPAPASDASRLASKAFFAKEPDLATAEAKAREACATPDADALNLLAAIRLSREGADEASLLQALAFSTQASAIDPRHAFARVNAARAMQRLGWRNSAKAAMASFPAFPEGSWQRRQVDAIAEWLASE